MAEHTLSEFADLIRILPVREETTIAKKDTFTQRAGECPPAGRELLGRVLERYQVHYDHTTKDHVEISRQGLFALAVQHGGISNELIIAVFIWGFGNGGQGNNFVSAVGHLDGIRNAFCHPRRTRNLDREGLKQLRRELHGCGIGATLVSKLLYFLGWTVDGHPALILDSKIIMTLNRRVFKELLRLEEARYDNVDDYLKYNRTIHEQADELNVKADQIEMFLFRFGNCLRS